MKMTNDKFPKCPNCRGTNFHYEGTFTRKAEWDEAFGEMIFASEDAGYSDTRLYCSDCKDLIYEEDLIFPDTKSN